MADVTETLDVAATEWVVPDNYVIGSLLAECWGPGGRGNNGTSGHGGAGGGGGAYAKGHVTVARGEVCQVFTGTGNSQNPSFFANAAFDSYVQADAGTSSASGQAANCIAEVAWSGSQLMAGQAGFGTGGGGSAFPTANAVMVLGRNGGIGFGVGGDGAPNVGPAATGGSSPGGGGGGGWGTTTFKNGASGADGRIILTYQIEDQPQPVMMAWPSGRLPFIPGSRRLFMVPAKALILQAATLLGADSTTVGGALKVAPFKNNLTPTINSIAADITPSDFTGSTAVALIAASRVVATDPLTGDYVINIPPPAGGWRWVTGDAVNLPQWVYGIYVCTNIPPLGTLYGTFMLETPIELTAAGQQVLVDADQIVFRVQRTGIV